MKSLEELAILERGARCGEFVDLARTMLAAKGDPFTAARMAESSKAISLRVKGILKAAVSAGSLSDPGWAGSLIDYRMVATGFLDALRSTGCFDRMLADGMQRVPLMTRLGVVTMGAAGATPAPGAMKPISKLSLSGPTLAPVKATAIICLTDELVRATSAAALALLSRSLRASVAGATDALFLSTLAAIPTPIASSGTDAAAVLADLAALLAAVDSGAGSRFYLVTTPALVKMLAVMPDGNGGLAFPNMTVTGGEIAGIGVLPSDQIAAQTALLVDAAGIAAGDDVITLTAATSADLVMDDAPAAGAQAMVSLFQTNSRALRAERHFGFEPLRESAVASLSGINWGAQP